MLANQRSQIVDDSPWSYAPRASGRHRQKRRYRLGFSAKHEVKLVLFVTPFFWAEWHLLDSTVGRILPPWLM